MAKISITASRGYRDAEKKASRQDDAKRLQNGVSREEIQKENSIFPAGFFDGARIENLRETIGR